MAVEKGNTISVTYTGTLSDGSVFDSNKDKEPLTFEVGAGQLIKGFDEGVVGMQEGETKTIHIPADEAYGQPHEQLIQAVPKEALKHIPEEQVVAGTVLGLQGPEGQNMPATITKVEEDEVTFDLNHPLAGKDLSFEVTVNLIQ